MANSHIIMRERAYLVEPTHCSNLLSGANVEVTSQVFLGDDLGCSRKRRSMSSIQ